MYIQNTNICWSIWWGKEVTTFSEHAIPLDSVWGARFSFLIAIARLEVTAISRSDKANVEWSIISLPVQGDWKKKKRL